MQSGQSSNPIKQWFSTVLASGTSAVMTKLVIFKLFFLFTKTIIGLEVDYQLIYMTFLVNYDYRIFKMTFYSQIAIFELDIAREISICYKNFHAF